MGKKLYVVCVLMLYRLGFYSPVKLSKVRSFSLDSVFINSGNCSDFVAKDSGGVLNIKMLATDYKVDCCMSNIF